MSPKPLSKKTLDTINANLETISDSYGFAAVGLVAYHPEDDTVHFIHVAVTPALKEAFHRLILTHSGCYTKAFSEAYGKPVDHSNMN